MADCVAKLDGFLQFNEREILRGPGRVSHQLAEQHAQAEFARFEEQRRRLEATRPTSDFDKAVERVKRIEGKPSPKKRTPLTGRKKRT